MAAEVAALGEAPVFRGVLLLPPEAAENPPVLYRKVDWGNATAHEQSLAYRDFLPHHEYEHQPMPKS